MPSPKADVYAIAGYEPETVAYAMAKYSRSSLSLKDSIRSINADKSRKFLETFYFQYGHRSIADSAHVPLAIENISLLAAIFLVDESLWDGQERSTRYQDFSKREHYTPNWLDGRQASFYATHIDRLFTGYEAVFTATLAHYREQHPRPDTLSGEQYERTLRARAFDVARAMLPLATLTSVGQVTSARTLEGQISRMMTSDYTEVVRLASAMRTAVTAVPPEQPKTGFGPVAPTLLKYATVDGYKNWVKEATEDFYLKWKTPSDPLPSPNVTLHTAPARVGDEIVATLLYEHTGMSFASALQFTHRVPVEAVTELITRILQVRGPHDELPKAFRAGAGYIFDLTLDIGAMRDMHRHRRCTQTMQKITPALGVALEDFPTDSIRALAASYLICDWVQVESILGEEVAAYLAPLATKCRLLMKMDFAEAIYITELRSKPAGHISYRRVARQMFEALTAGMADHSELTGSFRVTDHRDEATNPHKDGFFSR
jgi:thymidylate synthase ThyX